jgi:hypothetical protein
VRTEEREREKGGGKIKGAPLSAMDAYAAYIRELAEPLATCASAIKSKAGPTKSPWALQVRASCP